MPPVTDPPHPSAQAAPVWLLDVDGVVNVTTPRGWGTAPAQGWVYTRGEGWKIRWSPVLVGRLRGLHRSGAVELRWCTTFCPVADQLERLMGLPSLLCALDADGSEPAVAPGAKLEAAYAVVEQERRPLVWTDDDAVPAAGPARARLESAGIPVHLVSPQPNKGLRPEHLDDIVRFVEACR